MKLSDLFRKRFEHLLDYTPFIQADIAKMLGAREGTVTGWSCGTIPSSRHLVGLCPLFFGVDERYLLGLTNRGFLNGRGLEWQRENVPQGEKD